MMSTSPPMTRPCPANGDVGPLAKSEFLFVAGWMRSGTTLLGSMLGSRADHVCLGELFHAWSVAAQNKPCSCGAPADRCPVWAEALGLERRSAAEIERLAELERSASRMRRVPLIAVSCLLPERYWRPLDREYVDVMRTVLRGVAHAVGPATMVDTSKAVPAYLHLRMAVRKPVQTTVIVRRPAAVAYSESHAPQTTADARLHPPRRHPLSSLAHWTLSNALWIILSLLRRQSVVVTYDQLISEPDVTLSRASRGAAISDPRDQVGEHILAGNPSRFRRREGTLRADLRYAEDRDWRRWRRLTELMGGPLWAMARGLALRGLRGRAGSPTGSSRRLFHALRDGTGGMRLPLVEQVCWSIGYFALSSVLAFVDRVQDFAQLSLALALSLVGIASARALSVESLLVSARVRDRERFNAGVALIYGLSAAATASAVVAWPRQGTSSTLALTLPALASALVIQDCARYVLITTNRLNAALKRSMVNAATSVLIAAACAVKLISPTTTVRLWTVIAFATAALSIPAILTRPTRVRGMPWRDGLALAAESLVGAITSQSAILVLSLTSAAAAVAGVRVAGALVFGAAGLLLQGLHPQVLRRLDEARNSYLAFRRVGWFWTTVPLALFLPSCAAYLVAKAAFPLPVPLVLAGPYIIPVGINMMASSVFAATHLVFRYHSTVRAAHIIRLSVMSLDLALVAGLCVLNGERGVVAALWILAGTKLVLAIGVQRRWIH
jgi:hypothetical protein